MTGPSVIVFEDDQIATLAIHMARAWRPRPAEALPFLSLNNGPTGLISGRGILLGWSFNNKGAGNTMLTVTDDPGGGAGPALGVNELTAGQISILNWLGPNGVEFTRGVTVTSTDSCEGIAYVLRHVTHG